VLKNQFLVIARQWRKLAEHADRHAASDHVIVAISQRREA
jgi:hypothetical protein